MPKSIISTNRFEIDVRSITENGEVVCRDSTLTGQTVIAGFTSMMNNDDELEFTVVTAEGKGEYEPEGKQNLRFCATLPFP